MDGRPEKRAKKPTQRERASRNTFGSIDHRMIERKEALSRGGGRVRVQRRRLGEREREREKEKGRKSIFCAESVKEKRGREGKDCCSVPFCCGKKGMEFRSYREERRGIVMKGGGEDRKATRGEERRREREESLFLLPFHHSSPSGGKVCFPPLSPSFLSFPHGHFQGRSKEVISEKGERVMGKSHLSL